MNDDTLTDEDEPEFDPEVIEEAKKWGWKSPEDWVGDPPPRGFQDPDEFLETPRIQNRLLTKKLDDLQSSMEGRLLGIQRTAEDANRREIAKLQEAHEHTVAQIRAEQRNAAQTGDMDEYDRQTKRLERVAKDAPANNPAPNSEGPNPGVQTFIQENPWFSTDPAAAAVAKAKAGQIAAAGGGMDAQLRAARDEVHKRFPEYGPAKPAASKVDPGGIGGGGAPKKALKDKLPAEAKVDGERYVKRGLYKDLNEYAKVYFEHSGEGA